MVDFDINASDRHSSVKRRSITNKLMSDDPYEEGGGTNHEEIEIEGIDESREEERETLLASKKRQASRMPFCYGFRRCMGASLQILNTIHTNIQSRDCCIRITYTT